MDIPQLSLFPVIPLGGVSAGDTSSKTAKAAGQFEALLIGEMLKSVREGSDDGWLGGGSDSSAESAFSIAENEFAQTISEHGGFGLAKTIQRALDQGKAASQPANGRPKS
jgi:Rod binding domain-containing protein